MTDPDPSLFDVLTAGVTPDRLLHDARATGAGVKVAVVDTGIDSSALAARHPEMEPIRGIVYRGTDPTPYPDEGKPSSFHGTTVADILLTLAPKATLFSADVFGPFGDCDVETVVHAIRYAVDVWKVKVVNLSLGVPENRIQQLPKRQALYRAIEEAYFQDVLVFAAANNDHPLTKSYPAAIAPPLFSVDKALFDDPLGFAYRLREKVEFQAHGRAYLGPFVREPATSWATPHLAGIAAKLLSLKPDLKLFELKTLLYWMFRAGSR
ncbi:MAG TPA: S8 family serine peptidase [Fimbriiglobus sp.]|jgi:subtilisin family serine protease